MTEMTYAEAISKEILESKPDEKDIDDACKELAEHLMAICKERSKLEHEVRFPHVIAKSYIAWAKSYELGSVSGWALADMFLDGVTPIHVDSEDPIEDLANYFEEMIFHADTFGELLELRDSEKALIDSHFENNRS